MRFTLRQLEVFLAVAHHQSISRAADELAMSQSAVSGSLKELEQKHSAQLFDRVGKRLQLNELGARLRPSCEALLVQAAELEQEFTQQRRASEIRVGATLTVGNYLCVELIDRYRQRTGEGRVHLEVANTRHIVRELLDFNIDLGMIEGEVQHPDLDVIPWQSDELVCICAPAHHLAATGELGMRGQKTDIAFKDVNWKSLLTLIPYLLEFRARILVALLCLVGAKLASVGMVSLLGPA